MTLLLLDRIEIDWSQNGNPKATVISVFFALDKNYWVCRKWLLHSTVTASKRARNGNGDEASPATVECSNHFEHTQQFLFNAKNTLTVILSVVTPKPSDDVYCIIHTCNAWSFLPRRHPWPLQLQISSRTRFRIRRCSTLGLLSSVLSAKNEFWRINSILSITTNIGYFDTIENRVTNNQHFKCLQWVLWSNICWQQIWNSVQFSGL